MNIEIKKLSFGYSTNSSVINDLNLSLNNENIVAILGVSGSGKSTLMRLLSGLLDVEKENAFKGLITIDDLSPTEFRKKGKLSFMFQESALMPNLTVYENIYFPLHIKNLPGGEKEINNIIQSVGLTSFKDYLPKSLSGGMKTRVALARSFVTYPKLLLLDEPFASLDIAWKSELYNELKMFREKFNTTVIFVTHDIEEALLLSNKILILGINGNIIKTFHLNKDRQSLYEEIYEIIINDHKTKYITRNVI